jgi:hypothetical protein
MRETITEKIKNACKDDDSIGAAILVVIGALTLSFSLMCLWAWIVMLLWNWIAVSLFGAPVLTFWVAFGLRLLCALLFKSKTAVNKKSK